MAKSRENRPASSSIEQRPWLADWWIKESITTVQLIEKNGAHEFYDFIFLSANYVVNLCHPPIAYQLINSRIVSHPTQVWTIKV